MGTMSYCQPENWLYEIWQKGQDRPCYVMVPNANDLVKSHLMIAVREEVEVLKERITELMEKINQLEVENTILKKNVPQETLSELQLQQQQQAAASAQQQTQQQHSVAATNIQPQTAAAIAQQTVTGQQTVANPGPPTTQQPQQTANGPVLN